MRFNFFLFFIFLLSSLIALSQQTEITIGPADISDDSIFINDSVFIFTSPRPLIFDDNIDYLHKNIFGVDLLLSNSGFGFGFFYDRILSQRYKLTSEIFFTPVKNTEEIPSIFD